MSLQDRTLVIKNFDPEKTTKNLLTELFIQGGPVRNVVIRPDHAFVEYEDEESVGYSKALLDGIELFGKKLELQPKARLATQMKYVKLLNDYIAYDKQLKQQQEAQRRQLAFYQSQPQIFQAPQLSAPVYNMQPLVQPGPPFPLHQMHNPNPQIFASNPFMQQPQTQFILPGSWPSSSIPQGQGNSMGRSLSFGGKNQPGISGNFNRNHRMRNSERRRR